MNPAEHLYLEDTQAPPLPPERSESLTLAPGSPFVPASAIWPQYHSLSTTKDSHLKPATRTARLPPPTYPKLCAEPWGC